MALYICIDIGGTSVKYGIYKEAAGFIQTGSIPTQASSGGTALMQKVILLIQNILSQGISPCGICVSTAGMVDHKTGSIAYASSLIPGYTGTPVKKLLEERFHLPCEVENDVNCAALAEFFSGSAKGCASCLCLTVGTGIGGAFISCGKLLRGFSGYGCEVGYMLIDGNEFQKLASASTLVENVAAAKNVPSSSLCGKHIFSMAADGDADCIYAIDSMCRYLGVGIANLCYVLNPQTVVLGGGIMVQKEILYDKINSSFKHHLLRHIAEKTTLAFAQNQNRAGMLGAYYHFIQKRKG